MVPCFQFSFQVCVWFKLDSLTTSKMNADIMKVNAFCTWKPARLSCAWNLGSLGTSSSLSVVKTSWGRSGCCGRAADPAGACKGLDHVSMPVVRHLNEKMCNDSLTIEEKCRLHRSESGLINSGIESFSIDFCQTLLTAESDCMNVTHRLCWEDSSHANLYGGYDLCSKSPQPQSGRVL